MATIRPMRPDETEAAVSLVVSVFEKYVRPDFVEEGWASVLDYVNVEAMRERQGVDHCTFVAEEAGDLAGLIELRHLKHVSLLAVDERFSGRGIARTLLARAIEHCRQGNPELDCLTVNSSPFAVGIYKRLGFEPTSEEMVLNGIRFTPMSLRLP